MKIFKSTLILATLFFSNVLFADYERKISSFAGDEKRSFIGQFNFEYIPEVGIIINNKHFSAETYLIIPKDINGKYNEDFDRMYALIMKAADHKYTVIFAYETNNTMNINVPSQDFEASSWSRTKKGFILNSIKLHEATPQKVSICGILDSKDCAYVSGGQLHTL